jgi:hypothetical protein
VLALSPNGDFLYVTTIDNPGVYDPITDSRTVEKISIADTSNRTVITTIVDDDGFFSSASVNGNELAPYVEEGRVSATQILGRELIRVDLATLESRVILPRAANPFSPAADSGTGRSGDYMAGSNNCDLVQIADGTTGATISYGQSRYGRGSTWYSGNVLTNGYKLAKGGNLRCDATGMITAVDAATSAETQLVRGYDPDGR